LRKILFLKADHSKNRRINRLRKKQQMRATGFLYFTASDQSPMASMVSKTARAKRTWRNKRLFGFCVEGEPPEPGA
jgi:hypothetical protein